MSNFRASATVTATLALEVLQNAATTAVPGATVTMTRPDAVGNSTAVPRVNIYLYQISPNAAWRNRDLPTRDSAGQLVQRPRLAVDLHYLLTFYGDETQLEPQRLLGNVALAMHAHPVLTRDMIRNTIVNPAFPFLAQSNLADEVELVKFTPLPLSLEELSKMWSVLLQTQYTLSTTYMGTVILLESEETPRTALPVLEPDLFVVPFRHPTIDRVRAQAGVDQPIVSDTTLVIEGSQLRGDVTQLRIGGSDLMTLPNPGDSEIVFALTALQPPNALRAGVQPLQIIQPMMMGRPPVPHVGIESNVSPIVVHPKITQFNMPDATHLTVDLDPIVGARQRVVLLLNSTSSSIPLAYTFMVDPRTADTASLTIPLSGVTAGDYWLRVQIDGAESLLEVDLNPASPTYRQIIGPTVTVP